MEKFEAVSVEETEKAMLEVGEINEGYVSCVWPVCACVLRSPG